MFDFSCGLKELGLQMILDSCGLKELGLEMILDNCGVKELGLKMVREFYQFLFHHKPVQIEP